MIDSDRESTSAFDQFVVILRNVPGSVGCLRRVRGHLALPAVPPAAAAPAEER